MFTNEPIRPRDAILRWRCLNTPGCPRILSQVLTERGNGFGFERRVATEVLVKVAHDAAPRCSGQHTRWVSGVACRTLLLVKRVIDHLCSPSTVVLIGHGKCGGPEVNRRDAK